MECGRTVIGGEVDEDDRYISPTVLADITTSDAIMQEEVKIYHILSHHITSHHKLYHISCIM